MIGSDDHMSGSKFQKKSIVVSASMRDRFILVVDDEDMLRRAAKRLLIQAGFHKLEFASGFDEAEEAMKRSNPDLLVVDIHLDRRGVFDGLHLVRRVRARGYGGIVVVMSGDFSAKQVSRAAAVGADDFLVKGLYLDFRQEIVRILSVHYNSSGVRRRPDTITELGYFRSFGLISGEIELLQKYCNGYRFPNFRELAAQTGQSETEIEEIFSRICEKLGVSNLSQLTHRLTNCMMFHQNRG